MYEKVKTSHTPRRDVQLAGCILLGVMLLILIAFPLYLACRGQYEFHNFVQEMADSVLYSRQRGGALLTVEGETVRLEPDNMSHIYSLLTSKGSGKEQKELPDTEELFIDFGDGSTLQIWNRQVRDAYSKEMVNGLFISYVDHTGKRYSYDTDLLSARNIESYLPPEAAGWVERGKLS
ncbi:MAG: hypothetical protein E7426_01890 [Ruminococcaceae bacterium]|jgi:hypothetical protein|nr:hypothetical protein [Oscillospiraceae bacterium]